MVMAVLESS